MISKVFVIRDRKTLGDKTLRVIATRVAAPDGTPEAQVLEGTPGGACPGVILLGLLDGSAAPSYSPFDHEVGGPAMRVAHQHLVEHWFDLGSGSELDVESILKPGAPSGQESPRSGRA